MTAKSALAVWVVLTGVSILECSNLRSATVTLLPVKDTSIFRTAPNNNVGGASTLASGGTANNGPVRMMFQFDVAGNVPAGASITSAELQLTVVMDPPASQASTFGLHPLLVDWGEGTGGQGQSTGTGRLATQNEATWNNRFHPSTPWAVAGGMAGTDFGMTASGTAPVDQGTSTFVSTESMIQDVQGWLDNPTANFGWIAISQSESTLRTARRFGSKENTVGTRRPTLTIDYEPFRISNVASTANGITFEFQGNAGSAYEVEGKGKLNSDTWTTITNVAPLAMSQRVSIVDEDSGPSQFYRLKRLPGILRQPLARIVTPGESATFSVAASGSASLTYQWRRDGIDIDGATGSTFTILSVTADDLGDYSVLVSDGTDSVLSAFASLMFAVAPTIVGQPQSLTNAVGSTATFTVTVTNTATLPIRFIWRKNFVMSLVTNELFSYTHTLTITNVQPSDAGAYRASVSNPVTSGLSQEATLTVVP